MTNMKKEILTQAAGLAGTFGVSFTGSYATFLLSGLAMATGHKIAGVIILATGEVITWNKAGKAYDACSNWMAEQVDLDYWWRTQKEEVNSEEKSTEKEA